MKSKLVSAACDGSALHECGVAKSIIAQVTEERKEEWKENKKESKKARKKEERQKMKKYIS